MQLDPEKNSWMTAPELTTLFAAFPEGALRFVGGCVRNALWDIPVADIDTATPLTPDEVIKCLDAANIRYAPTGIDHGTITAVINKMPHEITSLRKDVETDGRRAVVAFTKDWAEDAQRRDLTVNAIYADLAGNIYDPTGQGLDDITSRKFRFVGSADARVREDYLRILRFFRFIAWYGDDATIDADALKACRENSDGLKKLSSERIWIELKKILSAPNPERAMRIMLTNDILETVLPQSSNVEGLALMLALEQDRGTDSDPLLRLMAMSMRDPLHIARLCRDMKMSSAESKRLITWANDATPLDPTWPDIDIQKAVYTAGGGVIADRALVRAAGAERGHKRDQWLAVANTALSWTPPSFPLKGKDLRSAGIESGPEMGRILQALEALWLRSGFKADKAKLMMAMALIQQRGN